MNTTFGMFPNSSAAKGDKAATKPQRSVWRCGDAAADARDRL
jgi:hypothetical protein